MRAIFISYRREDTEGQAGRLFDDLAEHFGEHSVFMDVAGIEPGRDFRRVIDEHVDSCGVLLAMIGKSWIDAKDASGRRRLDDPMDFVRLETASALKRDIPVIPVLVHGASMPRAEQLPEELTELAYRNGVEVTHSRWDSDVQVLAKALSPYVESLNGRANAASSKEAVISKSNDASQSARSQKPSNAPLVSLPTAKTTFATILAASLALLVVGVSGYLWHQVSSESAQIVRQAELLKEVKKKIAAEELNAKRRAEEKAMAEALEAKKQAAERALAAETEARRRVQEKALAQELEVQRQTQERMHAQELEAKKRAQEAELEKRTAEERAEEIALAEKRQAESRARERAAEEREKIRLVQERAAAQRARWPSYNFPPPNGGLLVYTIMPDGNPACASYDGGGCLWGVGYDQIDFRRLKPLVCGEQHRARFGVTGYENLKHWCSLARRLRR